MSDELMISGAEIEALAAKLDGLDSLSERERLILTGVFVLAGQAAVDLTDEVSGFMPTAVEHVQLNFSRGSALPGYLGGTSLPAVQKGSPGSLVGSFSWGMGGGHSFGDGGGAGFGDGGGAG